MQIANKWQRSLDKHLGNGLMESLCFQSLNHSEAEKKLALGESQPTTQRANTKNTLLKEMLPGCLLEIPSHA